PGGPSKRLDELLVEVEDRRVGEVNQGLLRQPFQDRAVAPEERPDVAGVSVINLDFLILLVREDADPLVGDLQANLGAGFEALLGKPLGRQENPGAVADPLDFLDFPGHRTSASCSYKCYNIARTFVNGPPCGGSRPRRRGTRVHGPARPREAPPCRRPGRGRRRDWRVPKDGQGLGRSGGGP